jgi:hypothetical protein
MSAICGVQMCCGVFRDLASRAGIIACAGRYSQPAAFAAASSMQHGGSAVCGMDAQSSCITVWQGSNYMYKTVQGVQEHTVRYSSASWQHVSCQCRHMHMLGLPLMIA